MVSKSLEITECENGYIITDNNDHAQHVYSTLEEAMQFVALELDYSVEELTIKYDPTFPPAKNTRKEQK